MSKWYDNPVWGLLVIVVLLAVIAPTVYYNDKPETIPIVSLRQNDSLSFVLGSGGTTPTYYAYRVKAGGYTLMEMPARWSVIYQDAESGGYVKQWYWRDNYEIHVPPGTIVERYVIE